MGDHQDALKSHHSHTFFLAASMPRPTLMALLIIIAIIRRTRGKMRGIVDPQIMRQFVQQDLQSIFEGFSRRTNI